MDKEIYFRRIVKDNIKAQPGAVELIKSLAKSGVKMAVASSGPPENIELMVSSLGIKDCFGDLVPGREVTESKPSPLLFLRAAEKLGAKPEKCVVVEDALNGIAAAKAAGMRCVAVETSFDRSELLRSGADAVAAAIARVPATIRRLH